VWGRRVAQFFAMERGSGFAIVDTMAEGCDQVGVTRRTLRPWCAAEKVESRFVGQRAAQVRWVKLDTLPTDPTDGPREGVGASSGARWACQ
jgi:hypothetical protein